MTDEERQGEKIMKLLKLEKWNVGAEIFQYNKSYFDKEIENMDLQEDQPQNQDQDQERQYDEEQDGAYDEYDPDYEEAYEGDGDWMGEE